MRVGVPREVKNREYRVALTPAGVTELVRAGHTVLVEQGAGLGSSIPDADFVATNAKSLLTQIIVTNGAAAAITERASGTVRAGIDTLLKLPHVTDVRSDFALRTVKSTGPLPL